MVILASPLTPSDFEIAAQRVKSLRADLVAAQTRMALTTTAMAGQIGISGSSLRSILSGATDDPRSSTAIACLVWLGKHDT